MSEHALDLRSTMDFDSSFEILHIWDKKRKIYVDHENPDQKSERRPPNKFAVFVKDNYKNSRTPGKTHSEAMKELGQMFAQI